MWHKYKYTLGALVLASCISIALVWFRVERTGNWRYLFLIWNLFLAWIPLIISFWIHSLFWKTHKLSLLTFGLVGVWLMFYPNAPYLLTDLIHLKVRDNIPLWYDLLLIMSFVTAGGFAGFVSLYLLQNIVKKLWGRWTGWLFVVVSIVMGSFGVYFGRFLRWNSWDLVSQPSEIASDVVDRVVNPLAHKGTFAFTLVFTTFSIFCYALLYAFSHLHTEWDKHT